MIRRIMEELEFPKEATDFLADKYRELMSCEAVTKELHLAYDYLFDYKEGIICPCYQALPRKAELRRQP